MSQESNQESVTLVPWDPKRFVRKVDPGEVRLSRGFLRSRPEKWFPAFATHWLPLIHSLGVEVKLVEVKPLLVVPKGLDFGFSGTVDHEPIGFFIDGEGARVALDAFCPGATDQSREIVLEYLARRLLSSLALSWSGSEASVVQFTPDVNPYELPEMGTVKLAVSVHGTAFTVWLALGRTLVERFDGLWRRQIQSSSKLLEKAGEIRFEVGQLAVPPSMLADYMKSGTVIDLEIPVSDTMTLRLNGKPWIPVRLCEVSGKYGFETLPGPAPTPALPEGTTRLSIEFGIQSMEPITIAELAQVGAIYESDIKISNRVDMIINGEKVAGATLCSYEGRFAISVD